jgi:hypothetical protein
MRPIDFCHPYDLRVPASRAFPARCRSFRCVDTPQSLGSARLDRGTERFTTLEDRFGGSTIGHVTSRRPHRGDASVGVLFPRRRFDRASDIPVASPLFSSFVDAPSRVLLDVEGAAKITVSAAS